MSEKYLGEVSTPLLINQIKEKCTLQVNALPTASIDELGKSFLLTAPQTGYIEGGIYKCEAQGTNPETYAWELINSSTEYSAGEGINIDSNGEISTDNLRITGRYNVLDYGLVGDGATDNTTALRDMLASLPWGSIVYFPKGIYNISEGITISKTVYFEGDTETQQNYYIPNQTLSNRQKESIICYVGNTPNVTLFNITNSVGCKFRKLTLFGNAYEVNVNDDEFVALPYPYYKEHIILENVNGINRNAGIWSVEECQFNGFSGFAVKIHNNIYVKNCGFFGNKVSILEEGTDSMIQNCFFTRCGTAVKMTNWNDSSETEKHFSNINMSDCWCDQMADHVIMSTNTSTIMINVDNMWADMIDKSAISAPNAILSDSNIQGRFSRCGMTYAGITDTDEQSSIHDMSDVICIKRASNCEFNIITSKREIGSGNNQSGICPYKLIYTMDDYHLSASMIVTDLSYDDITSNSGYRAEVHTLKYDDVEQFTIWGYDVAKIHFRPNSPIGRVKALGVNRFCYDTSTKTLYRSTAADDNTAWEPLFGTAATKNSTDRVMPNSTDLVESRSVYSAIQTAVSSIYTPRGEITCAELTSDLLISDNIGNVYETSDSGTTTALFLQGAGVPIATGTNIGIINAGQGRILFNLMANAFDLTSYQKKDLTNTVEGATTVEGALSALSNNKQAKTLTTSVESQTTVESALGALSTNKQAKTLTTAVEGQTTVESALGALSTNKATQAEVNDMNNVLGAKNLIPFPYHRQNEYTTYGATFTYDDEGVITINKVSGSSTAYFALFSNILYPNAEKFLKPNTSYILSMELENATNTSCFLQTQNGTDIAAIRDKATGKYETSFTTTETIDSLTLGLYYGAEATENNAKAKLMIRLASDPDNTYVPYAPTNAKLNEEKVSWKDNGILGAKNFIPFPYPKESDNVLGIDFTANSNGEVIASGTSTGIAVYDVVNTELYGWNVPREGTYILSDGLSYADYEYAYTAVTFMYNDGTVEYNVGDTSIGRTVITIPSNLKNFYVGCCIRTDKTVSNIKFKPMLRLATDSDDTYQLYAMTNRELTSDIQTLSNKADNIDSVISANGAKNLLPNTGTSNVNNSITYTVNSDGSVSTSGTVESGYSYFFINNHSLSLKAGTYHLSGTPSGLGTGAYIYIYGNGAEIARDNGSGADFTLSSDITEMDVLLRVNSGINVTGQTFKPMITLASQPNSDYAHYVPYAMTNRELTGNLSKASISASTRVEITASDYNAPVDGYISVFAPYTDDYCRVDVNGLLFVRAVNGQCLSCYVKAGTNMRLNSKSINSSAFFYPVA